MDHDEFISSGFFILRTPLFPIEELLEVSGYAQPAVVVNADNQREHLRHWVQRPEVQEALWLASPELLQLLPTWWDNPGSAKGRKLERALYRYLARMTARATPFGAFAGVSAGTIAGHTCLELAPRSHYRRRTRLDMECLLSMAGAISADRDARAQVNFRPNTSLHLAAERYHHMQSYQWGFRLVATGPTPALDATLWRAQAGMPAQKLAAALTGAAREITPAQADEFIGRLIDSELLVSDLTPPVTGPEAADYMIEQLDQSGNQERATRLRSLADTLEALDREGLGCDLQAYETIAGGVRQLGGEFVPGRLVQVDVIKPALVACLEQKLVEDIVRAINVLHSVQGVAVQPALQQFKRDFRERYGSQEVPLLEALDDEAGIGFESYDNPTAEPLLAGIDFRLAAPVSEDQSPAPVLERRLRELKSGITLELDSELLQQLHVSEPLPLPDVMSAMGVFFRGPDGMPGFHLQSVCGPSGANLFARFSHADAKLREHVHQLVRAERTLWPDDVVFAEIAHLPEGRVGNVVCRPHLRQYEIPFLATSALPPDRQIPLSDLTVSLRGGRIVLRSQRLRREVLPRLTSAHNFHGANNLKLYKFLCLLQEQDVTADLSWSWGACAGRPFLPRVTWGNVVFCLAQWRLAGQTAHQIFSRNNDEGQRRLRQWRIENQLPRFVFITEHDNQLLIDFESDLSIDALLDHIHKNQETLLVEMFPPPGALPVRGPEGAFVHEMVLPLQRRIPRRRGPAASSGEDSAAEAGGISTDNPISAPPIASGWLFAKLFCSPTHADRLLSELVQPLVKEMIHPWFFSRYDDPHWHLRLRFQGDPASLNNQVLPMLMSRAAPFRRQGIIWRLEFEAYESEVERYGGPQAIAVAERIFQFDSELCMDLLPFTSGDDGAQLRWQLAFCGVDRWLTALGLDLTEKNKLAASMRASREQDYIVDQTYREQIARKFRSDDPRNTLLAILSGEGTGAGQLFPEEAMSSFARFSALLEEAREQLKALERAGQLTRTIPELAVSFVHMHLNRLLRASHLAQEAVLFDFLARTYAAKLAQGRT